MTQHVKAVGAAQNLVREKKSLGFSPTHGLKQVVAESEAGIFTDSKLPGQARGEQ